MSGIYKLFDEVKQCTVFVCSSHVQVQAGLGLSEFWYSWIVSVTSIGLFIGSILLGFLTRWIYAKYLFVGNLLVCIAGSVLYAVARNGWMLLSSEQWMGIPS